MDEAMEAETTSQTTTCSMDEEMIEAETIRVLMIKV